MSTESIPPAQTDEPNRPSLADKLRQRLSSLLSPKAPEDRQDLQEVIDQAHADDILDDEAYSILTGTMGFSELVADDIQVSRSKMDMIDIDRPLDEIIDFVIDSAHSRFPVYQGERDNIIGLLLAKDLLQVSRNPDVALRTLLRPAHFVPETKRLNQLLKELKEMRSHLALVIDEYGSVTGLVTMEDILEEIVGDIEDEYDEEAEQTIFPESDVSWRVMAVTDIDDFNKALEVEIPEDEHDTIGGWLAAELDQIPKRGDSYYYGGLRFYVLRADEKRALWLHVRRQLAPTPAEGQDSES